MWASDALGAAPAVTPEEPGSLLHFRGGRGRAALALQGAGFDETATLAWVRQGHSEDRAEALLDPVERAYYESVPAQRRRSGYLLGRHAAKYALGAGSRAPQFCIEAGVMGQPVLTGPGCCDKEISISHQGEFACAVVGPATTPITLDLEAVDPRHTEAILARTTQRERALCGIGFESAPHEWATVLWTAKEALSKFLRCGLGCDLQVLEIAGMRHSGERLEGHFRNFPQYRFISWVPAPDYVLTLVLPAALALSVSRPDAPAHRVNDLPVSNDAKEDIFDVGSAFRHSADS